jgi:hypothetical protein
MYFTGGKIGLDLGGDAILDLDGVQVGSRHTLVAVLRNFLDALGGGHDQAACHVIMIRIPQALLNAMLFIDSSLAYPLRRYYWPEATGLLR